eukprot:GGOE01037086.1.p1 GENE.GGOE01037086.1~~GGOE01037086.1.p1  ORF type:complete len:816 (-),score=157.93 GGOE01037086.1:202-2649(-)
MLNSWKKSVASAGKALYEAFLGTEEHTKGYEHSSTSKNSSANAFVQPRVDDVIVNITVYGVDLGNQVSHVSIPHGGGFECLLDDHTGKRSYPTLVSFTQEGRHLGDKAEVQLIRNWKNTACGIKRLVGLPFNCVQADHERKFLLTPLQQGPDGGFQYELEVQGTVEYFYPEQLLAMVLNKLACMVKAEAQKISTSMPSSSSAALHTVLAVPVWFTSTQRERLLDAAKISGVDCLGLINEATAAALEWGVFRGGRALVEGRNIVAFVDCGQSATTISVVEYGEQRLEVLGHVWDACLGGRDFDYALYEHFAAEVRRKHGFDVERDARSKLKLLQSCEKLKKVLSANASTHFECDLGEFDIRFPDIQRGWFEALVFPFVQKVQELVSQALSIPLLAGRAICAVEVLGGASRIPCVKAALTTAFGVQLSTQLNADEAVARGCGIMAAQLSPTMRGQVRRWRVLERHPLPVLWSNVGAGATEGDSPMDGWQVAFDANAEVPAKCPIALSVPSNAPHTNLLLAYDTASLPPFMVPYVEPQISRWDIAAVTSGLEQTGEGSRAEVQTLEVEIVLDTTSLLSLQSSHVKGLPGSCVVTQLQTMAVDRLEELQRAQAVEVRLREMDEVVRLTAESKNALESYVIASLRAVQGEWMPYMTPADGAAFRQALEDAERWLYEEGEKEELSTYRGRLSTLKEIGDTVEQRRRTRMDVQQQLQDLNRWLGAVRQTLLQAGRTNAAAAEAVVEEAVVWAQQSEAAMQEVQLWQTPQTSRNDVDCVRIRVTTAMHAAECPFPTFLQPPGSSLRPTVDVISNCAAFDQPQR